MIQYSNLLSLIEGFGFQLESESSSDGFGDFIKIYGLKDIELRICTDRTVWSIDIRRKQSSVKWWDLALVKALINHETNLNKVYNIDDYVSIIKEQINDIVELFSDNKYLITESKLYQLSEIRARQLFPNAYI